MSNFSERVKNRDTLIEQISRLTVVDEHLTTSPTLEGAELETNRQKNADVTQFLKEKLAETVKSNELYESQNSNAKDVQQYYRQSTNNSYTPEAFYRTVMIPYVYWLSNITYAATTPMQPKHDVELYEHKIIHLLENVFEKYREEKLAAPPHFPPKGFRPDTTMKMVLKGLNLSATQFDRCSSIATLLVEETSTTQILIRDEVAEYERNQKAILKKLQEDLQFAKRIVRRLRRQRTVDQPQRLEAQKLVYNKLKRELKNYLLLPRDEMKKQLILRGRTFSSTHHRGETTKEFSNYFRFFWIPMSVEVDKQLRYSWESENILWTSFTRHNRSAVQWSRLDGKIKRFARGSIFIPFFHCSLTEEMIDVENIFSQLAKTIQQTIKDSAIAKDLENREKNITDVKVIFATHCFMTTQAIILWNMNMRLLKLTLPILQERVSGETEIVVDAKLEEVDLEYYENFKSITDIDPLEERYFTKSNKYFGTIEEDVGTLDVGPMIDKRRNDFTSKREIAPLWKATFKAARIRDSLASVDILNPVEIILKEMRDGMGRIDSEEEDKALRSKTSEEQNRFLSERVTLDNERKQNEELSENHDKEFTNFKFERKKRRAARARGAPALSTIEKIESSDKKKRFIRRRREIEEMFEQLTTKENDFRKRMGINLQSLKVKKSQFYNLTFPDELPDIQNTVYFTTTIGEMLALPPISRAMFDLIK